MPIYEFICNECDLYFEEIFGMNDIHLAHCPVCDEMTKSIISIPTIINSTPRTLGSLSEQNRKRLGSEEYSRRVSELKEQRRQATKFKGKLPDGSKNLDTQAKEYSKEEMKLTRALNTCSPEAKEKYIMTGSKPFGS